MKRSLPALRRSVLETTLALATACFAVLAAAWPDWIETLGVNPDRGNGSFEWAIPILLALAAVIIGLIARRHWRIDAAKAVPN